MAAKFRLSQMLQELASAEYASEAHSVRTMFKTEWLSDAGCWNVMVSDSVEDNFYLFNDEERALESASLTSSEAKRLPCGAWYYSY